MSAERYIFPGLHDKAQDFAMRAKAFMDAHIIGERVLPEPYNRIVSQPETGVTLIEPLQTDPNAELDSIKRRYCAVTGFSAESVMVSHWQGRYLAIVNVMTVRVNGSGKFVGNAYLGTRKMASDYFDEQQLSNKEVLFGIGNQ